MKKAANKLRRELKSNKSLADNARKWPIKHKHLVQTINEYLSTKVMCHARKTSKNGPNHHLYKKTANTDTDDKQSF